MQVHNAMGFCYVNMEKRANAVKEYSKATKLKPGYVTAWNNLGDAYEKESQWKDAQSAYETAYELQPDNQTAKNGIDRTRMRVGTVPSS